MSVQYTATGRRKRAIARAFVRPGTGEITVNGRAIEEFFCGRQLWLERVTEPLIRLSLEKKFNVLITTKGGGIKGQVDACRLAIARALVELADENKPVLKGFGLLTRDPREVERKHYYCHKARKMPQYSKR
jgi:small subunit ribosomal protein S9